MCIKSYQTEFPCQKFTLKKVWTMIIIALSGNRKKLLHVNVLWKLYRNFQTRKKFADLISDRIIQQELAEKLLKS